MKGGEPMNAYEELLSLMRTEGGKDNPASIQIGIMEGPSVCSIGS